MKKKYQVTLGLLSLGIIALIPFSQSHARPQYAIKRGIVSCTACHYSPAGGGTKNVFGKAVASHDLGRARFTSQDIVSADFRAMAISALKDTHENLNGVGLMSGAISSAIPIAQNLDGSEAHIVATYDFASFTSGTREIFVRWQTTSNGGIKPKHIVAGKFNIPFGHLTDAHRTYIRRQSKSSSNDYEAGLMLSGNLVADTHYDLALVQGFQKGGGHPTTGGSWGIVPNFRFMFKNVPLSLGISGLYFKTHNKPAPTAISLYSALAIGSSFSMLTEFVWAKNSNDPATFNSYLEKFVDKTASPTYYSDLLDKESLGAMIRFDYDLTGTFSPFIKIDYLAPDQAHLKDYYIKNSIGFRYWISSNIDMDAAFETTMIGRDGIEETKVYASKDSIIFSGHAWF